MDENPKDKSETFIREYKIEETVLVEHQGPPALNLPLLSPLAKPGLYRYEATLTVHRIEAEE